MIKVAVDSSSLKGAGFARGVGYYTQRLVEAISLLKNCDFKVSLINFKKTPKDKLKSYDLWHYPYFDPFFLTLPRKKIKPTIVTVHDLIPIKFPQYFPKGVRGWFKWQLQKFSLKNTSAIITDSNSSFKDIVDLLKVDKKKVFPIYLAADSKFQIIENLKAKSCLKKYLLPEKFILYVGDLNWNKNIQGLIKAFSRLDLKTRQINLVFVGGAFLNKKLAERKEISRLLKQLKLDSYVKFLGFVPTQDLVCLYNLAVCLCQPSYYEGFGLPVIEAMACGCPVICALTGSLPEIAGEAAVYINPGNIEEIKNALDKIITDKSFKNKSKDRLRKQAENFSWENTANQTLKVYQKIYNEQK